jgi:hypothetical protein
MESTDEALEEQEKGIYQDDPVLELAAFNAINKWLWEVLKAAGRYGIKHKELIRDVAALSGLPRKVVQGEIEFYMVMGGIAFIIEPDTWSADKVFSLLDHVLDSGQTRLIWKHD